MITMLRILNSTVDGWIVLFLVVVSVGMSLGIFLIFKGNRNKKSVLKYTAMIFGVVEICDLIWLQYDRRLIAKVSMGFNHSTVYYYEPVNFMIMRKTSILEEMYDGPYDKYDRIE